VLGSVAVDGELSRRSVDLRSHYGAVVVGSGYGGAVIAARLAQAGVDVAVLERGREWPAGTFPDSQLAFAGATSLVMPRVTLGRADALFRFQVSPHYSTLTGSGLGGTSLINAGVVLRPPQARLEALLPGILGEQLERGFARAFEALDPATLQGGPSRLKVLGARRGPAGHPFTPVPVTIALERRLSSAGQQLQPCNACGNCVTGCNVGAKGSLDRNYLPLAAQHGAELFTGVEVRRVVERDAGMGLFLSLRDVGRERFEKTELFITADVVVLAGGSLGSTEVLWRSRDAGLPVSAQLGQRFSGNGTVLAFTEGLDEAPHAMAEAWNEASGRVGPSLIGMFDLRDTEHPMVIQDTAIPRALGPFVRAALATSGRGLVGWAVTSGDDAGGRLTLERDRLQVHWSGAGRSEHHQRLEHALERFSRALGGKHRRNPASLLPWKPLITTHPLGGCALGEHGATAVVDADHRVFRGPTRAVHERLYVCDGSVFPGAPGTNPLWTISAMAERCAERLLEAHPTLQKRAVTRRPVERPDGVGFTERMHGWLSPLAPAKPAPKPQAPGAVPLSFLLTVEWPSARALEADPSVLAASVGTVRCRLLAEHPLTVTQGRFQLFVDTPEGTQMKHELRLRAADGTEFLLEGHKEIVDDPGPDLWHDTRTLFIRVTRLDDGERVLVGHGVVQTGVFDLATQVQTIRGVTRSMPDDLRARGRFLRTFLGRVRREYQGLVGPLIR